MTDLQQLIKGLLGKAYPQASSDDFEEGGRTFGVVFKGSGLEVDLVPIVATDDANDYGLQYSRTGDCVETSVKAQIDHYHRHAARDPLLATLLRLVKRWRYRKDVNGVQSFQKIDDARALAVRLLIILSTNRFAALDPAVVRRASLVEFFGRPTAEERRELFKRTLGAVALSPAELDALVAATGERGRRLPFTFCDVQTRLIPTAVARAFPDRALAAEHPLAGAAALDPSPSMEEGS